MHVYEWLKGLDHIHGCAPLAVKIGRETYYGASYFDGERPEPILYLLGNLPPSYKRSSHTCYRFPGEEIDWYVAGFADAAVASALPQFHPFGAWFQVRQWPTGGETIDHFHERPYRRMKIEEVY